MGIKPFYGTMGQGHECDLHTDLESRLRQPRCQCWLGTALFQKVACPLISQYINPCSEPHPSSELLDACRSFKEAVGQLMVVTLAFSYCNW